MEPRETHSSSEAPSSSAPSRPAEFSAVYRVLEDAIAARAFPCCSFGVLAGGNVVLQDSLGRFTYENDAPEPFVNTLFDVASLTKVVATTSAVMLLNQRGLLDLDTPLGELLPGFVVGRPAGSGARLVTLRHLFAHSSGLPGYAELYKTAATPTALFRACLELPLEAAPGTRAEYSDPGFILLGKAIEVLVRDTLDAWIAREVFQPLSLSATRYNPPPSIRDSIPPTEDDTKFRQRVIQGEVQDENASVLKGVSGHAGLFSNVPDLLRFSAAVLAGAANFSTDRNTPSLFAAETVQRFAQRQKPDDSSRALGWDTPSENSTSGRYFSAHSIGHLGFSGCSLWIDLDADLAVVLLTNRTWPDRATRLIREVWPRFHDAVRESIHIP